MADEPKVVALFGGHTVERGGWEDKVEAFRKQAIGELEEILEMFRRGECVGFAMIFTHTDGGTSNVTSEEASHNPIEYLGALERLKHRLNIVMDIEEGVFGED